jgi:hypothetical protein
LIWATPNGGSRHLFEAMRLKREGVVSGVPDLIIAEPTGKYHGLFIEMKSDKGKLQDSQREMIGKLTERGYRCDIAYSLDDFMCIVKNYFNADK